MSLWQRHRASLLGIPVALALALLLSGQRLELLWDATGPREPVAVDADGWARINGQAPISPDPKKTRTRPVPLAVRAGWIDASTAYSTGPGAEPTPVSLPDGLTLWRVKLTFRADPDDPVSMCKVIVTDEDGAEYGPGLRAVPDGNIDQNPCLPPATPGPNLDGTMPTDFEGAPRPPRPQEWDRYVSFVMPSGRIPQSVRVWFAYPQAAVFPLDPGPLPSGPGSG